MQDAQRLWGEPTEHCRRPSLPQPGPDNLDPEAAALAHGHSGPSDVAGVDRDDGDSAAAEIASLGPRVDNDFGHLPGDVGVSANEPDIYLGAALGAGGVVVASRPPTVEERVRWKTDWGAASVAMSERVDGAVPRVPPRRRPVQAAKDAFTARRIDRGDPIPRADDPRDSRPIRMRPRTYR